MALYRQGQERRQVTCLMTLLGANSKARLLSAKAMPNFRLLPPAALGNLKSKNDGAEIGSARLDDFDRPPINAGG